MTATTIPSDVKNFKPVNAEYLSQPEPVSSAVTTTQPSNHLDGYSSATGIVPLMLPVYFAATLFSCASRNQKDEVERISNLVITKQFEQITAADILLLEAALGNKDFSVAADAAFALGQIAKEIPDQITPSTVAALTLAMGHNDISVAAYTAFALEQIVLENTELITPEAVQALVTGLTHQQSGVRLSCKLALTFLYLRAPEKITNPATIKTLQGG